MLFRCLIALGLIVCPCFSQYFQPGPTLTINYSLGYGVVPYSHAVGDFDGDGRKDLFLIQGPQYSGPTSGTPIRFHSDIAAGFSAPVVTPLSVATGLNPLGGVFMYTARVNGDAYDDVILEDSARQLFAYVSDGQGGLIPQAASNLNAEIQPRIDDIDDIDGDGDDDLLVQSYSGSASGGAPRDLLRVLRNDGGNWTSTFTLTSRFGASGRLGEFNGDGLLDLCCHLNGGQSWWGPEQYFIVRYADPGGGYLPEQWNLVGSPPSGGLPLTNPFMIDVVDLDYDGISDIIHGFANYGYGLPIYDYWAGYWDPANSVMNRLWLGGGVVGLSGVYSQSIPAKVGRLTGGLRPDFLLGETPCASLPPCGVNIDVFRQTAPRSFSPCPAPETITIQGFLPVADPYELIDLDGDGDDDLFVSTLNINTGSEYQIFLNRALTPASCGAASSLSSMLSGLQSGSLASFSLSGAQPGSSCVLGASTASNAMTGACPIGLDLSLLLLPTASGIGLGTTDLAGGASVSFLIPNDPALSGAELFTQWLVLDPAGTLPTLAGSASLSETRYSLIH